MDRSITISTTPLFRRSGLLGMLALGVVLLAAYANSFGVPFIFDDPPSIIDNPSVHSLRTSLFPPTQSGLTSAGRPLVNMSLAINYALGGANVFGYHAVNLGIHFLAALCLFGLVRRTVELPGLREKQPMSSRFYPLAVAFLWALHPLQTESVTYVVQRAESMVGLFYLLTLYCFVRSIESAGGESAAVSRVKSVRWQIAAFVVCLLGMGTKEVMVSAPFIVFVFDRIFVSGSFAAAWTRRRGFYLALAATWVLLAGCVISTGDRGGTAGFGTSVSSWHYALTQFRAIPHYLQLVFWPHPLVLDYGTGLASGFREVALPAALVVLFVLGTLGALRYRPDLGFLGLVFFAVLAPSSSLMPVATQTMAEHRMYLALAPVLMLVVLVGNRWLGRAALVVWTVVAVGLGGLTFLRNRDYRSELAIWENVLVNAPTNARAWRTVAVFHLRAGRIETAARHFDRALELDPGDTGALTGRGSIFAKTGRNAEALAIFEGVLRLDPKAYEARYNLGKVLLEFGRAAEAVTQLEIAVRIKPGAADARHNLGNALVAVGRLQAAIEQFEAGLKIEPASVDSHNNLGLALAELGRGDEAIAHFNEAVRLAPESAASRVNRGRALCLSGRFDEGRAEFEHAVRLDPALVEARANLGNALVAAHRPAEAVPHYEAALAGGLDNPPLRLALGKALLELDRPDSAISVLLPSIGADSSSETHYVLANALAAADRLGEAVVHFEEAVRLTPEAPEALNNLGIALARLGRLREAQARFEQALRAKPDYSDARDNLARVMALGKR